MRDEEELNNLQQDVEEQITAEFHEKFCYVFGRHGLGYSDPSVPLAVWMGVAQAMADASGYAIAIQVTKVKPDDEKPDTSRFIGYRQVAVLDPLLFVETETADTDKPNSR